MAKMIKWQDPNAPNDPARRYWVTNFLERVPVLGGADGQAYVDNSSGQVKWPEAVGEADRYLAWTQSEIDKVFGTERMLTPPPPPADTPPTAPGGLAAMGVTSTTVSLSWTASADDVGVVGYEITRDNEFPPVLAVGTITAVTVGGLEPNTTYTFSVRAKDTIGQRSAASNAVQVTTVAVQTQAPAYFVQGRFLKDPDGATVVVRGAEQVFWSAGWLPNTFVTEIGKSKANAVRILPYFSLNTPTGEPKNTLAQIEDQIKRGINAKMLVDVAIDLGKDHTRYLDPAVKTMVQKYQKHIVIHAKGESNESTGAAWATSSKAIITAMRNAGYVCPLYIMTTTSGRNLPAILNFGQSIIDADPLHNVVFGWQAYWGSSNHYQNLYGMTLDQGVAACANAPFPIQVGLIWHSDPGKPETVDYGHMMQICQQSRLGWLWWDWRMGMDDLTTNGLYGGWHAPHGEPIVVSNPNSINNTSVRTPFQLAQVAP